MNSGIVTMEVLSENKSIPETFEIYSVTVNLELNQKSEAVIHILDGKSYTDNFEVSNSEILDFGNKITIELGHDSKNNQIFSGKIIKKEIIVNPDSESMLIVTCQTETLSKNSTEKRPLSLTYKENIYKSQLCISATDNTKVTGSFLTQGTATTIGSSLTLNGFGQQFSKTAPVTKISHEIGQGNWMTFLWIGDTH